MRSVSERRERSAFRAFRARATAVRGAFVMRATAAFLALLAALSVLTRVDAAADVAVLELVGASFAAADAADADARGTTRVVRCVARQNASSSELRVVALAATLPPNRAPVAGTLVPAGDGVVLGAWPRDADALECVLF